MSSIRKRKFKEVWVDPSLQIPDDSYLVSILLKNKEQKKPLYVKLNKESKGTGLVHFSTDFMSDSVEW